MFPLKLWKGDQEFEVSFDYISFRCRVGLSTKLHKLEHSSQDTMRTLGLGQLGGLNKPNWVMTSFFEGI